MKPEEQKTIFKLFKTMDTQIDPNKLIVKDSGAIGMGIIVSKMIIENFGGKLDFSSEYQVGSTFVFSFEMEIFNQFE